MSIERRYFLQASLKLSAAACVMSVPARASTTDPGEEAEAAEAAAEAVEAAEAAKVANAVVEPERKLRLANVHTRETLDVVYWADGNYINDNVGKLHFFMRDHHTNKPWRIDKKLYDYLYRLHTNIGTDSRIHVLSGYRTPKTNEALRKKLKDVAKNSYHMKGKAVDFYIPGVDNEKIQAEARKLKLGGVGYYTKRHFVHLDTGRPRFWLMS